MAPSPGASVIELQIAAEHLPRLLRGTMLAGRRAGRARLRRCRRIWHDTPGGHLRAHGLALSEQDGLWRLERLLAEPACPPVILAEGAEPTQLHRRINEPMLATLAPIAAFTGTLRHQPFDFAGEPGGLDIIEGALRGVARDEAACRLRLCGPTASITALAGEFAAQWPITVPPASLAACAMAVALGVAPPAGHLGAPEIAPGASVGEALPRVIAHLTRVLLHWAAQIPALAPGENLQPVHQARVAARRLRSALAVFRRAAGGAEGADLFRALGAELKAVAGELGAARDWDVFLAGDGAAVGQAFATDKRLTALLGAAGRWRAAAYGALSAHLGAPAWRQLTLRLALLPIAQPWQPSATIHPVRDEFGDPLATADQLGILAAPAEAYGAHALQRSFRRVTAIGEDLSALTADALHDARKSAKRLRYACEFFAPLFPAKPTRRFMERLEDVQEALGAVNDGHVAAALMAHIAGKSEARYAHGVVEGYVAAAHAPAARRAARAWAKLIKQEVFWE